MALISDLKTRLAKLLRDTANQRWTDDEKTECLSEAILDNGIVSSTRDTSHTANITTQEYDLPDGVEIIEDIFIKNGSIVTKVPYSDYTISGGKIFFPAGAPVSGTMIIVYKVKLTDADNIPDKYTLFILHKAAVKAYEMLLAQAE